MLVSESATSALIAEGIRYYSDQRKDGTPGQRDEPGGAVYALSSQSLERQGVLVGLRLTERLLYREPSFGGTALDIARFVGFTLWRAVFGKKVDSLKSIGSTYYLSDDSFKWLQGYEQLRGPDRIYNNSAATDTELVDESSASGDEVKYIGHRNVLSYTVGLIKGSVHLLLERKDANVYASFSKSNETQVVIEFNKA